MSGTHDDSLLKDQIIELTQLLYKNFNVQVGFNEFYYQKNVRWKNSQVRRGHGRPAKDFNVSKEIYWQSAIEFFETTNPHQVLVQRNSGSIMKYDFRTSEFGIITADSDIITYYRLDWEHRQGQDNQMNYLGENLSR